MVAATALVREVAVETRLLLVVETAVFSEAVAVASAVLVVPSVVLTVLRLVVSVDTLVEVELLSVLAKVDRVEPAALTLLSLVETAPAAVPIDTTSVDRAELRLLMEVLMLPDSALMVALSLEEMEACCVAVVLRAVEMTDRSG